MSLTERYRNKLFKMKQHSYEFYSFDSRTTNQTSEEIVRKKKNSNKKVSFVGVEIIDVESYKQFNKLDNTLEFETVENQYLGKCEDCKCIII